MRTRRSSSGRSLVCSVPLLDMRRYNKLLAGASWMAEYGDPDVPEQWEYIRTFSPYHLFDPAKDYPPTILLTSTRDDRVHPGHARKMFAKMQEAGKDVRYYENIEGGHGGAADNRQAAQKPRQWLLRKDLGQIAQAAGRQRAGLLVEKRPGLAVAVPLLNPEAPFGPAADHFVARTGQQSPATRKKPSLAIAKHQPREIRRRHRTGAGESQPYAQQGNPALHGASLKPWKTAWRTICSMCW